MLTFSYLISRFRDVNIKLKFICLGSIKHLAFYPPSYTRQKTYEKIIFMNSLQFTFTNVPLVFNNNVLKSTIRWVLNQIYTTVADMKFLSLKSKTRLFIGNLL